MVGKTNKANYSKGMVGKNEAKYSKCMVGKTNKANYSKGMVGKRMKEDTVKVWLVK